LTCGDEEGKQQPNKEKEASRNGEDEEGASGIVFVGAARRIRRCVVITPAVVAAAVAVAMIYAL